MLVLILVSIFLVEIKSFTLFDLFTYLENHHDLYGEIFKFHKSIVIVIVLLLPYTVLHARTFLEQCQKFKMWALTLSPKKQPEKIDQLDSFLSTTELAYKQ